MLSPDVYSVLIMNQICWRSGLCHGPRWGSLGRPPDLLVGWERTPLPITPTCSTPSPSRSASRPQYCPGTQNGNSAPLIMTDYWNTYLIRYTQSQTMFKLSVIHSSETSLKHARSQAKHVHSVDSRYCIFPTNPNNSDVMQQHKYKS